jgi:hypothetical protein
MNFSEETQINNEINISFFGITLESQNTGIGIEYKLPQYYFLFNKHMINFIYLSSHWNIFSIFKINDSMFDYSMMFGPFISINYLNWYINDKFKLSDYILNIGLKYSLRYYELQMFTIELGNKNTNGINKYYFSFEINFMTFYSIWDILDDAKRWK